MTLHAGRLALSAALWSTAFAARTPSGSHRYPPAKAKKPMCRSRPRTETHQKRSLRDCRPRPARPRLSLRAAPPLPQSQPPGRAAQALGRGGGHGEDRRMGRRLAPLVLLLCLFWGGQERLPGAEAARRRGPTVTAKVTVALRGGARVREGYRPLPFPTSLPPAAEAKKLTSGDRRCFASTVSKAFFSPLALFLCLFLIHELWDFVQNPA